MTTKPITIIGSGLAGYVLAKEFRKLDKTSPLTIVTQSSGHFYSKPLLSTALTYQRTPDALITTSMTAIAEELSATIYAHRTVTAINPKQKVVMLGEQALPYSKLILAVGADLCHLPLQGDAAADVLSVNHWEDYVAFRRAIAGKKRIAILGAGLVGCEFCNDLINAGYQVAVAALSPAPLDRFVPQPIGQVLQQSLADLGVEWHLNQTAVAINSIGNGYEIIFERGETLRADVVLSAVGLRPHTALAAQAGISVHRGIVVDSYLQTDQPGIYALGDCAEVNGHVLMFVSPLMQCARTLAKTLTNNPTEVSYPVMPIIVKTPACPLVFYPPFKNNNGEWHIDGDGKNYRALFFDEHNQLQGFALTGDSVREKLTLCKQIPLLF